jgi:TonB family protein
MDTRHDQESASIDASPKLNVAWPVFRKTFPNHQQYPGSKTVLRNISAGGDLKRRSSRAETGERLYGVLAFSLSAHVFVFVGLGLAPTTAEMLKNRAIEFEVVRPATAAPEKPDKTPLPEPPKPVEPLPKPKTRLIPAAAPKIESPPQSDPPPEPDRPLDFSGVTLTSEGGNWSTAVGNGSEIKAPVVTPRRISAPKSNGPGGNGVASQGVARAADLSKLPRPPTNLDALLTKYYPERARSQGIEGQAVLRVRIKPDGRVAEMRLLKESYAEFGKACMEHLRTTRWSPAQDRFGRTVAFDITYTCRFEVGY